MLRFKDVQHEGVNTYISRVARADLPPKKAHRENDRPFLAGYANEWRRAIYSRNVSTMSIATTKNQQRTSYCVCVCVVTLCLNCIANVDNLCKSRTIFIINGLFLSTKPVKVLNP